MSTREERIQILKMLEEGKVTVEEAEELLSALESPGTGGKTGSSKKSVRVKIWENGQQKVNVNLPLRLARLVMRFIPPQTKQQLVQQDIDWDEVLDAIENEVTGNIVEVEDNGDRVEVSIE